MNPWPFVLAAYGVIAIATALLLGAAFAGMRRAERASDELTRR